MSTKREIPKTKELFYRFTCYKWLLLFEITQSYDVVYVEVTLGDFVQIGAGSIINAGAKIEDEVFIGSGVTIVAGVTVGKGARVGAGSVVIAAVKAGETVFGNPAQAIKS